MARLNNYDKDILKLLTRIANALETIAKKPVKIEPFEKLYIQNDIEALNEIISKRHSGDVVDAIRYNNLNSIYGMSDNVRKSKCDSCKHRFIIENSACACCGDNGISNYEKEKES